MADRAEFVEAALEVYVEGWALLDARDRVVFWNRAAEAMTGYGGAQVLGGRFPARSRRLLTAPSAKAPALGAKPSAAASR